MGCGGNCLFTCTDMSGNEDLRAETDTHLVLSDVHKMLRQSIPSGAKLRFVTIDGRELPLLTGQRIPVGMIAQLQPRQGKVASVDEAMHFSGSSCLESRDVTIRPS